MARYCCTSSSRWNIGWQSVDIGIPAFTPYVYSFVFTQLGTVGTMVQNFEHGVQRHALANMGSPDDGIKTKHTLISYFCQLFENAMCSKIKKSLLTKITPFHRPHQSTLMKHLGSTGSDS